MDASRAGTAGTGTGDGAVPGPRPVGARGARLQQVSKRRWRDGTVAYGRQVAGLTAAYYRGLAAAAQSYLDVVADELLDVGCGSAPTAAVIELCGPTGGVVTTAFSVTNDAPRAGVVTLHAGTCLGPAGEAFTAPVELDPPRADLAAGASLSVGVRVHLAPELFTPGATYHLPLHVEGPHASTVQLAIAVPAAA